MPVELWFQCYCSSARPGDRLRVVGADAALGCWQPERSFAQLQTTAALFPLWQVPLPVLLNSPCKDERLEYRYVLVRDKEVEWEDLRSETKFELQLGDLGFDETAARLSLDEESEDGGFVNRRLPSDGDCIIFRSETFGQLDPSFTSSWPVCSDWAPGVAGGGSVVGRGRHRNSRNPLFKLQYQLPLQLFVYHRRGRLVSALCQMCNRIMLAPGLWEQILDYLGERPFRTCRHPKGPGSATESQETAPSETLSRAITAPKEAETHTAAEGGA
ncbi:unnamed protein product [Symbiodinium microadriaticum]|nr:unnamed protein product [Symbiodinium microadriaticum]CAE7944561.1 unnamed protein product [Symbiodinium sp. KB8]